MNPDAIVTDFMVTRGFAIAAYAAVEQALVELFAVLMRVSPDYAGVSFFRINNARARNAILDRLLRKRHDSKYNLFWNPIAKHLAVLDGTRNNVVHWGILPVVDKQGQLVRMKLTPPNYWDRTINTPKMDVPAMQEFTQECKYMAHALTMLRHVSSGKKPKRAAWRGICQQPTTYPPPKNHPLSPTGPKLQIPPLASRK